MIIVNGKVCRNMQEQVKKNKDDIEDITALDISQRIVDEVTNQVDPLRTEVGQLEQLIPEEASSDNQLADKDFVNSSIASNTANFRGTYESEEELPLTGNTPNDYAFVVTTDNEGNTVYKRFKWVDDEWLFEYDLNNSSFTASQWANINMDHRKFLQKYTLAGALTVYGTDGANQEHYVIGKEGAGALTIPQRTVRGTVTTSTPINDNDAATKKYVDDNFVEKISPTLYAESGATVALKVQGNSNSDPNRAIIRFLGKDGNILGSLGIKEGAPMFYNLAGVEFPLVYSSSTVLTNKLDKVTTANKIYGTDSNGNQINIAWSTAANDDTVVVRLGDGRIKVSDPVVWNDAANKNYVDNLVGTITGAKSTFKATKTDILTLLNTDALPLNKWISVDSGKITFQTRTSSTSKQTGGTIQDSFVYRTLYGGCMFKILLYSSSNNTFNIQYIEGTSSDSDPASTRQTITPVAYQYAYQRNQSSAINLLGKITVLE